MNEPEHRKIVMSPIDPQRIQTRAELTDQLKRLYQDGGWSTHRLAEAAGLSTGTVQGILNGTLPHAPTLAKFVRACGQDPAPWWQARNRIVIDKQPPRTGPVYLPNRTGPFVGRGEDVKRLTAALSVPETTGKAGAARGVVVQALHGLGGVGKSTLAAHWAASHLANHTLTWWITADTPASIEQGLADLAVAITPELAGQPLETLTEHALRWLASHDTWLLVLDNVTTPADVQPLLSRATTGRFLVTSRLATGWHSLTSTVLCLDVLDEGAAVDLLATITTLGRSDVNMDGAARLCAELGYLPLAVEQAGAYLHQTGLSPQGYLDLLSSNPAVMYDQAAEGANAERTIARIWRATLDRLTDTPLAGQILRILAWYGSEAIPRTLLSGFGDPALVQQAIGRLAAYNVIALAEDDTLTLHRLVQAVARTPDPNDPHRAEDEIQAARHQAARLLLEALPQNEPDQWPQWRALLPHVTTLSNHDEVGSDGLAFLLNEIGSFLQGQGAIAQAIEFLQRAHTMATEHSGTDHPLTLISRSYPAGAYLAAGDLGRAISLHESTLNDRERVLGTDHPLTLTSRSNLGGAYRAAGDLGRAISLLESTLNDRERVLGTNHPSTLNSRSNLAGAYRLAGNLGQAIPLYERSVSDCERVLGADHPDSLACRVNLASAYQAAGDLQRAIQLHKSAAFDCERVLGADHPDSLACRNNLASAYQEAGDLQKAIPLYERVASDCERALGEDHTLALTLQSNLAGAYQAVGDLGRAIRQYKRSVSDCERVLGTDHPSTLTLRSNLGHAYETVRNLGRALPLFKSTLADRERILGPDHPDTLTSRNNLARAYQQTGDLTQAIALLQQTVADCERVLSADHPFAMGSRNNLASAYQEAGDLERAIPLHIRTLADRERVLGANHPDTLISRYNLAGAYWAAGKLGQAIPLYKRAAADCERALGSGASYRAYSRGTCKAVGRPTSGALPLPSTPEESSPWGSVVTVAGVEIGGRWWYTTARRRPPCLILMNVRLAISHSPSECIDLQQPKCPSPLGAAS